MHTLKYVYVFQVKEWLQRKHAGGRAVIGISEHKTATQQVVTFALTLEEEAVSPLADVFPTDVLTLSK